MEEKREFPPGGEEIQEFPPGLACVKDWGRVDGAMEDPMPHKKRTAKKANRKDRKRRAAASLRKRGHIWWTHFGCRGQFFRRSLCTSNRSTAEREAAQLIALAEAGKIQATAPSVDERKQQKSASLKKSYADPKVHADVSRRNQERWDNADAESRKRHRESITASANRPGVPKRKSETSKSVWRRPGYPERVSLAVKRAWTPTRRKEQSKTLTAACARPEVKANRLAGRYKAAKALLERERAESDRGPGRPSMKQRNSRILELKGLGWTVRQIAEDVDPNFAKDPHAAMDRVRIAARVAKRAEEKAGDYSE